MSVIIINRKRKPDKTISIIKENSPIHSLFLFIINILGNLDTYNYFQNAFGVAKIERTILEKFDETRTIKIKGKNVDDLDLEKLVELIQQANKNISRFNLRGLFKGSKKSQSDNTGKQ